MRRGIGGRGVNKGIVSFGGACFFFGDGGALVLLLWIFAKTFSLPLERRFSLYFSINGKIWHVSRCFLMFCGRIWEIRIRE